MTETSTEKGSCLCGNVQVTVVNLCHSLSTCHCNMCRKWTGGPLFALDCGVDVEFCGGENISVYNSSDWAERGFCKLCGSSLFYRLKANRQYFMPAGLFDQIDYLSFDQELFIEEKPGYYDFANNTDKLTGERLFAMYAPES